MHTATPSWPKLSSFWRHREATHNTLCQHMLTKLVGRYGSPLFDHAIHLVPRPHSSLSQVSKRHSDPHNYHVIIIHFILSPKRDPIYVDMMSFLPSSCWICGFAFAGGNKTTGGKASQTAPPRLHHHSQLASKRSCRPCCSSISWRVPCS